MRLRFGLERILGNFGIAAPESSRTPEMSMNLDNDLLFCDELPPQARELIEKAEQQVDEVRRRTDRIVAALEDEAERECAAIRERCSQATAAAQAEASRELSPLLRALFSQLKDLQAECARSGQLDEALAIRGRLRVLRSELFGVKSDPGNLTDYGVADIGKSMIFEITGSAEGSIWGHDVYTADSRLAMAAVHSGALRVGERGLVRVTLIDGSERLFDSTERNGIQSLEYGNYTVGFRVERV